MGTPAPNEQSTGVSPWDQSPARRPGPQDFNNMPLVNRADAPPDPTRFPTANTLNGSGFMHVGVGSVVANATISIRYAAGSPVIDSGATVAGVSNGVQPPLAAGVVHVYRTPGGASSGDLMIYYASGTFPPPVARPKATLNGTTPGHAPAADWYTDTNGNSGVRVVTQNGSGVATDLPFTVDLM